MTLTSTQSGLARRVGRLARWPRPTINRGQVRADFARIGAERRVARNQGRDLGRSRLVDPRRRRRRRLERGSLRRRDCGIFAAASVEQPTSRFAATQFASCLLPPHARGLDVSPIRRWRRRSPGRGRPRRQNRDADASADSSSLDSTPPLRTRRARRPSSRSLPIRARSPSIAIALCRVVVPVRRVRASSPSTDLLTKVGRSANPAAPPRADPAGVDRGYSPVLLSDWLFFAEDNLLMARQAACAAAKIVLRV